MGERLFVRLEDDPLYAPETSVPAGTLREFAVPPALRVQVAHVMAYEETLPPGVSVTERVLPDGAVRLIFELQSGAPTARVAGPSARPVLLNLSGPMRGLSVTLRPGAARALFGLPAHELAECALPWADLVTVAGRDLPERLLESRDDADRVRLLLDALTAMRRDVDEPAPPRWSALAADAGFCDQAHLVREFQALCGMTPGQFVRRVSGSSNTGS